MGRFAPKVVNIVKFRQNWPENPVQRFVAERMSEDMDVNEYELNRARDAKRCDQAALDGILMSEAEACCSAGSALALICRTSVAYSSTALFFCIILSCASRNRTA